MLPTGREIKAARILIGLDQRQLASAAKLNTSTLSRMEQSGAETARGQSRSIQALVDALAKHGAEIVEDGIRLRRKKR